MNSTVKNVLFLLAGLLLFNDSLDTAGRTGLRRRTNAQVIDQHGEAFDVNADQVAREADQREYEDACAEHAEFQAKAKKEEKKVAEPEDTSCIICTDQFTSTKKLRCGHDFHKECIEIALKGDNRCPTCREPHDDEERRIKLPITHNPYNLSGCSYWLDLFATCCGRCPRAPANLRR